MESVEKNLNRNKNLTMGQKWLFEYGAALVLFISRSGSGKVRVGTAGGEERNESSTSEGCVSASTARLQRGAPIS